MFKQVVTLFRGRANETAEAFVDQNALAILKQQIRDAALSIKSSRQAVAIAIASHEQEITRYNKLREQITDLETRATAAIEAGKDELALEAAEAIAVLEDERASSEKAQQRFSTEIARLKAQITTAQSKLRDLQRGERLASATSQTQKLHAVSPVSANNTLKDAQETLDRLENRQQQIDLARKAENDLETSTAPADIAERMAAEGLGKPIKSSAESVLERLKAKQATKSTKKSK